MEQNELQRALMAILFAAGEPVAAARLSESLAVDGEVGVAQVIENETGCFLNESLVLWIHNSFLIVHSLNVFL